MIIKKPKFNTSQGLKKSEWPFTVSEVTVTAATIEVDKKPMVAFAVVHEFKVYALSGAITSYGLPSLEDSGIWKYTGQVVVEVKLHVNLTPFFKHVEALYKKSVRPK